MLTAAPHVRNSIPAAPGTAFCPSLRCTFEQPVEADTARKLTAAIRKTVDEHVAECEHVAQERAHQARLHAAFLEKVAARS